MKNRKIYLRLVEKRFTEILEFVLSVSNYRCILLVLLSCAISGCDSPDTQMPQKDGEHHQVAENEWTIRLKSGDVTRHEILRLMESQPTEQDIIDRLGKPTFMAESGDYYQLVYWRTDRPTSFEEGGSYLVSLTFYSKDERIVDWQTDYAEVEKLSEGQVDQYIKWSKASDE